MFKLQPFATPTAAPVVQSAFAGIVLSQWDVLRNDGDGNLEVVVGGQVVRKARELLVVLAGYAGKSFTETRRQFWMGKWTPNKDKATPPDCYSEDGVTPHAEAPAKQHTSCKGCPRSMKDSEGYTPCHYTKDLLVYLVDLQPNGEGTIVLDTPLIWRASAMSLFAPHDAASQSAGVMSLAMLLQKMGFTVFEQVLLQIGFHQSSKAPTLKVLSQGTLPMEEVERIIRAASQPDVKARLEFKPPTKAAGPALAPPPAAPALMAPPVAPPVTPPVAPPPAAPAFQALNLTPPASPATIAAAEAPVGLQAAPPVAPVTLESLQRELMATMAAGQAVDPVKLQQLQQLMAAQAAPAPAPAPAPIPAQAAAQVAPPASAQAAALAAFSVAGR